MLYETNAEPSSSDDDSVSLLCTSEPCWSREAPGVPINSSCGVQEENGPLEEHQVKAEISILPQRAPPCPHAAPQLGSAAEDIHLKTTKQIMVYTSMFLIKGRLSN